MVLPLLRDRTMRVLSRTIASPHLPCWDLLTTCIVIALGVLFAIKVRDRI
jgi:hypothetical protein